MRAVIMFDVYEIQLLLEKKIYNFIKDKSLYNEINKEFKLTFHEIIRWWILDRLDHICHVPVTNNTVPRNLPESLKAELSNSCRNLETLLWSYIKLPKNKDVEWIQATVEIRNNDLRIELTGIDHTRKTVLGDVS